MGAEYLFYVKFIATFALTFFGYVISVLASAIAYKITLIDHWDDRSMILSDFERFTQILLKIKTEVL